MAASAPNCIVSDSQHMSANGSPASEPVMASPRDDILLDSLGQSVPSARVIELETLLRQRDAQNEKLTVGRLLHYHFEKKAIETRSFT